MGLIPRLVLGALIGFHIGILAVIQILFLWVLGKTLIILKVGVKLVGLLLFCLLGMSLELWHVLQIRVVPVVIVPVMMGFRKSRVLVCV